MSSSKEHDMKYILLVIPLFFYRTIFLHVNISLYKFEQLINLLIIFILLILLLRHTALHHLFDWLIGVLFVVYFCILYDETIHLTGIFLVFDHGMSNFSLNNAQHVFATVNLIPLKGIISVIKGSPSYFYALYQVVGNVLMLAPLAFAMLYFKWTKRYKQTIWVSFICSVGIEIIQFLLVFYYDVFSLGMNRSVDIDALILNTISAGIGIGCFYIWSQIKISMNKGQPPTIKSIH
ncbi:VanZ family protein [Pullulanibacillus sp. KACC 23026]|uniref:VanZ family protein n=1 Tax=Pullulanibacillus sp. KACC 23026 TaxID=3028315 RepID=UPI0023B0D789|nr:VanZ family protein [Pullulanibacillus sp. KACC 23026]WEG14543.1 VanZ family protein [Pullulanibacillus sp. KACC 23026]